jgi:predicted NodU family carbamoyl transferase
VLQYYAVLGELGSQALPIITNTSINNKAETFIGSPTSGATTTVAANQDFTYFFNSSVLATQTILLPPITTIRGQKWCGHSYAGITTVTFETSAGAAITGAPTALPAKQDVCLRSDGSNWYP